MCQDRPFSEQTQSRIVAMTIHSKVEGKTGTSGCACIRRVIGVVQGKRLGIGIASDRQRRISKGESCDSVCAHAQTNTCGRWPGLYTSFDSTKHRILDKHGDSLKDLAPADTKHSEPMEAVTMDIPITNALHTTESMAILLIGRASPVVIRWTN